jgi:hypothetical protein
VVIFFFGLILAFVAGIFGAAAGTH